MAHGYREPASYSWREPATFRWSQPASFSHRDRTAVAKLRAAVLAAIDAGEL